ncbi:MAG: isoleucine--tRNA ligase, partial [Coxiellaceae bacterium]|nr:isoleucine--tRNA ligase [Coxiellaceae bacterium]
MSDYKNTLNLPETDFPMKASLAQREPETLQFWSELNLYQRLREQNKGRPVFMFHDGPPYANGPIHLGTSLNKTLKDIVVKSKSLSGFDAPFVPGWDCHGLPIELKVEKKVGKPGRKLSATEFRQACRDFAASQVDLQREDFKRLGVIADWENPYLTMDFAYEAESIRALATMIEKGHLHRGQKPVHWCTDCGSALAEAEVEYKDKVSPAIDVAFDVIDVKEITVAFHYDQTLDAVAIPIWTTTPWTLPANEAVSVNAKLDYVLVSCKIAERQRVLVIAKALLDDVMSRFAVADYEVLAEAKGEALERIQLQHPFLDRQVPVILGDHVTTDAGTGNVHTAPAHGQDDYVVGQRYGLAMDNPVDSRSCFIEGTPLVAGLHVTKANDPIIEALRESGHLLFDTKLEHSYPHCWRHKTPLIFRATPQWFISMEQNGLRKMGLSAIDSVSWLPDWGKNRIYKMVETRPDWCISRQRTWGIPIPLFVHKDTNELHPETLSLMRKAADLVEQGGIDAWFDLESSDFIGDEAAQYHKSNDVLDVWFDSGVSHACVLEKRSELSVPADLYLEGSDQHRGWFQTSLLTSIAMRDAAPYKTVLTHGYVVDGKGMKMSKSIGNTVAPSEVIKKYGADILRLWVASSYFIDDIRFSDEIIKRVSDAYRRIRNTVRFLLSNLYDFNPATDLVDVNDMVALDFWAVQTTLNFQQRIIQAYEEYSFQSIYQMIHNFCAVEMGSFYLDIIKDRQYTSKKDGRSRRSSQTAMYYILEALVRWLAPILSFTAEEIWKHMSGEREDSVFLSNWFEAFPSVEKRNESIDWVDMMAVRNAVNKVLEKHRQEGKIRSALDAEVVLYAEGDVFDSLSQLNDELRFLLITSDARVLPIDQKSASAEASEIATMLIDVIVSSHEKCER